MSWPTTPNNTNGRYKHKVLWERRGVPNPSWENVEKRAGKASRRK